MKNISSYFKLCLVLACLSFLACSDDNSIQNFPGGTSAQLLPIKISGEKNGGQKVFVYDDYVCLQAKVHQSHLSVLYFKPS